MYILFTIIYPIITTVTGREIDLRAIIMPVEMVARTNATDLGGRLIADRDRQAEEIFITTIKQDITRNVERKGYIVHTIGIEIEVQDAERYGMINRISMNIAKDLSIKVEHELDRDIKYN